MAAYSVLNRAVLEAACERLLDKWTKSSPAERALFSCDPALLLRVIRGELDDQHVPSVVCFFGCQQLWEQLRADGQPELAWLLQTISEAFAAFDESGGALGALPVQGWAA